jgi:hypothetical protein
MNPLNETISIIVERLNILDKENKRLTEAYNRIATHIAIEGGTNKGGIGGEGGIPEARFMSILDQANRYIRTALTSEQLQIVLGKSRDEASSRMRAEVICDLYRRGVSGNIIAQVLQKDHNCIYYHLALGGLVQSRNNKQFSHRKASKMAKLKRRMKVVLQ